MTRKTVNKTLLLATGIVVLFLLTTSRVFAECPGQSKLTGPTGNDPFHMLVIGDSIMWGQGLKPEQKFWWRVKCWLQDKTGREVQTEITAHSGAAIDSPPATPEMFQSSDGEVNLASPTINEQLDSARKFYGNLSKVDLILVNGCINDVDVKNLLNAATPLDSLEASIREKCGGRMETLLRRIVSDFPRAHVVVTSYYNMFSKETADNPFTRMLVKRLTSQGEESKRMTDEQMREKLLTISDRWYQVSTRSLVQAVETVNSELGASLAAPRILFAEVTFSPEHAFAAPDSLLWNFKFGSTNLSGLRKAIVILSLGTAAYKPNDQVRESRSKSCKQTYKRPLNKDEDKAEKERREASYLACRYASLGHPNQMGALLYAEAIKGQLQWLIDKAGWKRNHARPLASQ
jgi:hypothetical protein